MSQLPASAREHGAESPPALLTRRPAAAPDTSEWGTFKDSLRAPVHRWFTYPAGFSYKAVYHSLRLHGVKPGMRVYDPFAGTGTTNLAARCSGIDSCGTEAHPLVCKIAQTKLDWGVSENQVLREIRSVAQVCRKKPAVVPPQMPELVRKCYDPATLRELVSIRDELRGIKSARIRRFLELALISTLRKVSCVETGWPYIAPNKPLNKTKEVSRPALEVFEAQAGQMIADVLEIRNCAPDWRRTKAEILLADARKSKIPDHSIDHVFTSPPYLNNYDYADRTRLELYFMGLAENWADITKAVRNKLITAATTQVNGNQYALSEPLRQQCPAVAKQLQESIQNLEQLRNSKSGKKSYDRMVGGYFNDMHQVLRDVARVAKPGSAAVFILGDSAPYGVHIPTDELVGAIALGVGFSAYEIAVLRTRGGKWKNNPQRHNVALRESIVTIRK